jgi:hypothetical protein
MFDAKHFNDYFYAGMIAMAAFQREQMAKSWAFGGEWLLWVVLGIADVVWCSKHAVVALYIDHDRAGAIVFAAAAGLAAWSSWVAWRDRPRKKGDKAKSPHVVRWLRGRLRLVPVPSGA